MILTFPSSATKWPGKSLHFSVLHFPHQKMKKVLEGNTGENLNDFGYGDDLLDTTPKAWSNNEIWPHTY